MRHTKILLAVILLLLVATALWAADPVLIRSDDAAPGTYYLILTIAEDGSITITTLPSVVVFDLTGKPDPKNPTNPPGTVLGETVKNLSAAVTDPDKPITASTISSIYRATAGLPLKTQADLVTATNALYGPTLTAISKVEAWKEWKAGVDAATKDVASLADGVAAWGEIAKALEGVK